MIATTVESFGPNVNVPHIGLGLDVNGQYGRNSFQPTSVEHKFPPYYNIRYPKRIQKSNLQVNRPKSMPHQQFLDLATEDRRNLPDNRNIIISKEGDQDLCISYTGRQTTKSVTMVRFLM